MSFSKSVTRYLLFLLLLIANAIDLEAQILSDTSTLKLVRTSVDQIYNMQFRNATSTVDRIKDHHPEHPVVLLLTGLIVYWENYPLIAGSSEGKEFEDIMENCIEKCEKFEPENEAEYLLANMCARGSLLAYYAGNNLSSKVISLGSESYRYLRRSFDFTGSFSDFLFFTGLYNYYREAYAEAHPVYKPLLAMFPRGNREKGMYELRKAFRESIFLRAEASTFLSSNYKYFENDYSNASYFSRLIFKIYPGNIVYRINCIEDLILIKNYDEAEKLISSDSSRYNRYYMAQMRILNAILTEKQKEDLDKAEKEYIAGIDIISEFRDYGKQYSAYAYFGLSRISAVRNDVRQHKVYRRKAFDHTDFRNVSFD